MTEQPRGPRQQREAAQERNRKAEVGERRARDAGAGAARLETNAALAEAVALYRSAGYEEIPDYNGNFKASYWGEKLLR